MRTPVAGLATKAIKGAGAAALGGGAGALLARRKKDKLTRPGYAPGMTAESAMG